MAATFDSIVAVLNALLLELRNMFAPRKAEIVGPFTVTPGTTKKNIFAEIAGANRMKILLFRCRSVGTGTYIAVGRGNDIELRFTDDQGYEFMAPPGYFWDALDFTCKSDAADGALEVFAVPYKGM